MTLKQRPILNHSLRLLAAVMITATSTSYLHADTDKNAKSAAAETATSQNVGTQIVGIYTGDGVMFTIEWEKGKASGLITRNNQSFPFTGKADGKGIKGTFKNGGISINFSATLKGDELTFVSGSSTYKLKKSATRLSIAGTYQTGTNSISLVKANDQFEGFIILKGNRSSIVAKKQGQQVVGHYTQDEKKHPFSATLEGDVLTIALGIEQIKMKRIANAWEGGQSKRKVYESVLAKSAEAFDASILVSPDNRKVAFSTRRPDRFGYQVWINGKALKTGYAPIGARFSQDGSAFVHQMRKDGKFHVVVNDKPGDPYDEVILHLDALSADGKRSIYAARTDNTWRIVTDGKPGPPFDNVSKLFGFSPNGERYAYIGERNGQSHMVVDGKVSPPYEAVLLSWQTFSADSKHVHYAIARNGKQVPVVDGKELGAVDAVGDMRFSPAGDRFAYIVLEGSSSHVIVDGVATKQYDQIANLTFSPDGKTLAFPVRVDGKSAVIVNGKRMGDYYDIVSTPVFSADGKNVLFLAQVKNREFEDKQFKNKQFVVINGKRSAEYDAVRIAKFSPDSQRAGFIARKNDLWFVVVDGKASFPYFQEPEHLIFSPDSKHVTFVAKRDGSTYLVIDGTEGKPIWPMLRGSAIVFDEAKRFHTVVRRTDEFVRLDVEIVE